MLKKKKNYLKIVDLDLFGDLIKKKDLSSKYFKEIYLSYFFILIKRPIHLLLMVERPVLKKMKKKVYKKNLFYLKNILIFFYKNVKITKFITFLKKNRKKSIDKLYSKLEMRLDMVLYRFFLSTITLGEIKEKILNNNILVNFKIINNLNYVLNLGDIISLNKKYSKKIYNSIKRKFLSKRFYNKFFRNPIYLKVDYQSMLCIITKNPNLIDIPFFFKANLRQIKFLSYKY